MSELDKPVFEQISRQQSLCGPHSEAALQAVRVLKSSDRRPWMAAEEPIRRVWSSNEFVCATSGVLLKQLEGLKKEPIQKADPTEIEKLF